MRNEVATRYAKAFLESVKEESTNGVRHEITLMADQIRSLAEVIEGDPEVKTFFYDPSQALSEKQKVLEYLGKQLKFNDQVIKFVLFLIQKRRLNILKLTQEALREIMASADNEVSGTLYMAASPTDELRQELQVAVGKKLGRQVTLAFKESKEVGSGFIIDVAGVRLDDSLNFHLDALRTQINQRSH